MDINTQSEIWINILNITGVKSAPFQLFRPTHIYVYICMLVYTCKCVYIYLYIIIYGR